MHKPNVLRRRSTPATASALDDLHTDTRIGIAVTVHVLGPVEVGPFVWVRSNCGRWVHVPWIEASHAEGLEVLDAARRNGHLCGLGDGGDEGVTER